MKNHTAQTKVTEKTTQIILGNATMLTLGGGVFGSEYVGVPRPAYRRPRKGF